jgi:hypothetical protein
VLRFLFDADRHNVDFETKVILSSKQQHYNVKDVKPYTLAESNPRSSVLVV